MKISIVTVSFNGAGEVGKTIDSVLRQELKFPGDSIEYWIIDGKSTDGTVDVALTYSNRMQEKGIAYHVLSETDHGIYDGMNKGARLSTGDMIGFLNCGDTYEADTLAKVLKSFREQNCDILVGNLRIYKSNGNSFIKKSRLRKYQTSRDWNHPTTFVRTELMQSNPFLNKGIHDDYGFYLKMVRQGRKIICVNEVLANFYMGGVSNKKSLKMAIKRVKDRYFYCYRNNGYSRWYLFECVAIEAAKMILG